MSPIFTIQCQHRSLSLHHNHGSKGSMVGLLFDGKREINKLTIRERAALVYERGNQGATLSPLLKKYSLSKNNYCILFYL
ncbi:hypothetical protein HNQ88_001650 [Aureibacter tunicatorum]|uniref:Uncharacterized protein n=1 Tax=Aureibacter tunicatorum TaxID=866807 RepID=A0AAE3XMA8_9BACT|nr:hypothetical protein [Aureibacter tunicatorum]BDD05456.1 hypothetical protein AUTU_29390 [Aureibacter tunicatorum]